MKHLKDITVLVLGLGESGLAMARWSARCGATVRVWDSRETPPNAAALAEHVPGARLFTGALTDEAIEGVQLVLKSPGLAPSDERIAGPVARAADAGALLQGELELFARALDDLKAERRYAPKVIAITGTNGKTTTTSMAAQFIARTGKRVAMAGNIGPTMLQTLSDALDLEPVPVPVAQAVEGGEAAGPHPPSTGSGQAQPLPEGEGADPLLAAGEAPVAGAADALVRDEVPAVVEGATAVATVDVPPDATEAKEPSESAAEASNEEQSSPAGIEAQSAEESSAVGVEPPSGEQLTPGAEPPGEELPSGTEGEGQRPAQEAEETSTLKLIPPPPPAPVFEHLPEVWVLELSSFQLDEAKGFEPSAATVLNITQDHLDWHGDMAAYAAAKARIFGKNAVMVINRDDPLVEKLVPQPPEPQPAPKGKAKPPKFVPRNVVRFGLDAPRHPGDYGLVVENGMAWLVRAMEADETVKRSTRRGAAVEEEDLIIQRLMPAEAMRVRGRHNASNALAALALATAVGCPLAPMLHGLREYGGEPHRVEYIATVNGVDAFDDSKGTNVGATVAALNGLGADKSPAKLVVILGGDGKGQDFLSLAEPVSRHARAVATIGRDAQALEDAIAATGIPFQRHDTLEAATRWAFERAHAGDAVLLSPACASLDMFRNYAHRAEVFVNEVRALAAEHGEMSV